MKILKIRHRGLRRFIETGDVSNLPPELAGRIDVALTLIQDAADIVALSKFASLRVHQLTGNRKGTWSVKASANWRITFQLDLESGGIRDLNLEDYH